MRFFLCSVAFALALLSLVAWESALGNKHAESLQTALAKAYSVPQEALEYALTTAEDDLEKGAFALHLGHLETAKNYLETGLQKRPASPFAWHQLALAKHQLLAPEAEVLAALYASAQTGRDVPALVYPRLKLAAYYAKNLGDYPALHNKVLQDLANRWAQEPRRLVVRLDSAQGRFLLIYWATFAAQKPGTPTLEQLNQQFYAIR